MTPQASAASCSTWSTTACPAPWPASVRGRAGLGLACKAAPGTSALEMQRHSRNLPCLPAALRRSLRVLDRLRAHGAVAQDGPREQGRRGHRGRGRRAALRGAAPPPRGHLRGDHGPVPHPRRRAQARGDGLGPPRRRALLPLPRLRDALVVPAQRVHRGPRHAHALRHARPPLGDPGGPRRRPRQLPARAHTPGARDGRRPPARRLLRAAGRQAHCRGRVTHHPRHGRLAHVPERRVLPRGGVGAPDHAPRLDAARGGGGRPLPAAQARQARAHRGGVGLPGLGGRCAGRHRAGGCLRGARRRRRPRGLGAPGAAPVHARGHGLADPAIALIGPAPGCCRERGGGMRRSPWAWPPWSRAL
mmetsp:Transcript_18242/g.61004  ORF Transcript_18242/g.61004 Transcript_18242/m.61004 type:complete len:361 (+) Transcript_18242:1484-2566(+)